MAVKGEIKRRAVASLMLISLLDNEEKSPEESAIIQCFSFLSFFCRNFWSLRRRFQKLQKIATMAVSARSENTSDFNPSVILRGCIAIALNKCPTVCNTLSRT